MSIALGATSSDPTAGTSNGGSAIALQAQLERCKTQLSDWVNCSSGKTPEGKQIIAALQQKIGSLQQQIQQGQSPQNAQTNPQDGGQQTSQSGQAAAPVTPPVSLTVASIGSVGTLLNTVA